MSPRRIILIVVALVVSGLTIFLGRSWLEAERNAALEAQRNQQQPAQQPSSMVLVAKGNLVPGQFVRGDNLRWQPWPNDGISANYIVQGQRTLEDFIGTVARISMADGEPITETRLVRPGSSGFLAAVLEPGKRAVTVNVTPSSGIAGFVFPGDHVDVIVTMTAHDDTRASQTVLTDIRVLAMDQRLDDQSKDIVVGKTATLEVTPKQAEVIAVVSSIGSLSLSLRSIGRDEAEVAPENGRQKLTYTTDSDATQYLIRHKGGASGGPKVNIVRGGAVNQVEFLR